MNKIENVLFSLIKDAFCESASSLSPLSEEELVSLYALAKKHDVAHLVGYSLVRKGLLPKESAVAAKFQKQQMIAVLRQERLDYELSQICRVLSEASIRFLPLKGSVIRPLYPEAWMRTSCDIDVLVDEAKLDECVALLCERLGYTAEEHRQYHDISLHAPSGVHLELHFSILESMEQLDGELSRVWEFSAPMAEDSFEYRMTNEYLVFHCVAHMAYHFVRGGCGIRPLMDLFLLKRQLPLDEEGLRLHLRACSLEIFYERVSQLSEVWFGDAEPSELCEAMQEFLLSGGVYGSLENKVIVAQGATGGKGKYLLRRIFLPYESLARLYPVLQKHKILIPFCQVCRWFRVLFGGRARHSLREVRISSGVSDAQRAHTGELMAQLGLSENNS